MRTAVLSTLLVVLLAACGSPRHLVAPQLLDMYPQPGATGVPIDAVLWATFDAPIDQAWLASSLSVTDALGTAVLVDVSYHAEALRVTVTPLAPLAYGTLYDVVFQAGATTLSSAGALAADVGWNFTTELEPAADEPGDDLPGDDLPGDDLPGDDEPGDDLPGDGEPGDGEPGDGEPGDGEPGDGEPGDGEPGDGEPGDGEPGDGEPGAGDPGFDPNDPFAGIGTDPIAVCDDEAMVCIYANVPLPGNTVPDGYTWVVVNVSHSGNFYVGEGASLYAQGFSVSGYLYADGHEALVLIDSTIGKKLDVRNGGSAYLYNTRVKDDAVFRANAGHVHVEASRFDEDLRFFDNTGGVTVIDNVIDDDLECSGNDPAPTGSGNEADDKEGQCSRGF
jgi:hypothetical protein